MTDARSLQRSVPYLIGHRGACGHAPENTLASIRRAAELGATWVEVDAKLTADGVPILMHDHMLERTTDGTGAVAETNWSTLSKLDAGRWFSDQFAGARVLTLEDAIGHLSALDLGCNVEIKPCPGREVETAEVVCDVLKRKWPGDLPPPILSSFAAETMAVARVAAPKLPRSLLLDVITDDWQEKVDAIDASAIHVWHEKADADTLRPVIEAGLPVRAFTVNQRTRAVELAEMGFAGIFSDFPERMLGIDTVGAET